MDTIVQSFFRDIITHGLNSNRENILHYVCSLNEYQLIPKLLVKGCHLCQQDNFGRTPVHVAIEAGHRECIQVFQKLLQNYQLLGIDLQEDLCHLMKCYNHKGYTTLHEAVLRDMRELVQDLLNFCKQHNIKLSDIEVLGCGDTVLHLAVRKNFLEMAEILCKNDPKLVKCRNYGGSLPTDLKCITNEMELILKKSRTS